MDRIGDARNLNYNLQTKFFNHTGRNISRFVTKAFIFIPKQPNNKKLNFRILESSVFRIHIL